MNTALYHPEFPRRAARLGGKWSPETKEWSFYAREEEAVRKLCIQTYGSDGETADLVDVIATARQDMVARRAGIFLAGRCIARARDRDGGARLGEGVIQIDGPCPRSGGSRQYWETIVPSQCRVQVRDVPRIAVEAAMADARSGWDIEIHDA